MRTQLVICGAFTLFTFMGPVLPTASAADEDYRASAKQNERPMLGVEMTPVPANIQDREGLTPYQGVLVQSVYENTAASGAGVRPGDVILAINGAPITSMTDLRNEMGLTGIGDPVKIKVTRNGQTAEIQSQVKEWPANIPYEKLDAAAERRFRDWQDRRQQRLAEDLRRAKAELEQLAQKLADEAKSEEGDESSGKVVRPGQDGESFKMPALRLRLVITNQGLPAYVGDPTEAAPSTPVVAVPPWTFQIRLPSAVLL